MILSVRQRMHLQFVFIDFSGEQIFPANQTTARVFEDGGCLIDVIKIVLPRNITDLSLRQNPGSVHQSF